MVLRAGVRGAAAARGSRPAADAAAPIGLASSAPRSTASCSSWSWISGSARSTDADYQELSEALLARAAALIAAEEARAGERRGADRARDRGDARGAPDRRRSATCRGPPRRERPDRGSRRLAAHCQVVVGCCCVVACSGWRRLSGRRRTAHCRDGHERHGRRRRAADLEVVIHILQNRAKTGEQRVRTDDRRVPGEGLATGADLLYFPIVQYGGVPYYPDRPVIARRPAPAPHRDHGLRGDAASRRDLVRPAQHAGDGRHADGADDHGDGRGRQRRGPGVRGRSAGDGQRAGRCGSCCRLVRSTWRRRPGCPPTRWSRRRTASRRPIRSDPAAARSRSATTCRTARRRSICASRSRSRSARSRCTSRARSEVVGPDGIAVPGRPSLAGGSSGST